MQVASRLKSACSEAWFSPGSCIIQEPSLTRSFRRRRSKHETRQDAFSSASSMSQSVNLRTDVSMDKWLRLHLVKRFVNLAVRILNRAIPRVEPTLPQTKAAAEIYASMYKAFSVHVYSGVFDDVPYQRIATLKDRNFQHVLELSEKIIMYLAEMDRYYRGWLGLALLLAAYQVTTVTQSLDYAETLQNIRQQWEFPIDAIPREYFYAHKREFLDIQFAPSLSYLAHFPFGKKFFQQDACPKKA